MLNQAMMYTPNQAGTMRYEQGAAKTIYFSIDHEKKMKNNAKMTISLAVLPFGIWEEHFSKAIKGVNRSIQFYTILVTFPGQVEENINRF